MASTEKSYACYFKLTSQSEIRYIRFHGHDDYNPRHNIWGIVLFQLFLGMSKPHHLVSTLQLKVVTSVILLFAGLLRTNVDQNWSNFPTLDQFTQFGTDGLLTSSEIFLNLDFSVTASQKYQILYVFLIAVSSSAKWH